MSARFIGGPADGMELELPPGTTEWRFAEHAGLPWAEGCQFKEHLYVARAAGFYFEYVDDELPRRGEL